MYNMFTLIYLVMHLKIVSPVVSIILLDRFGKRLVIINEVKAVDDTALSRAPYTSHEDIPTSWSSEYNSCGWLTRGEKRIEIVSGCLGVTADKERASTSILRALIR